MLIRRICKPAAKVSRKADRTPAYRSFLEIERLRRRLESETGRQLRLNVDLVRKLAHIAALENALLLAEGVERSAMSTRRDELLQTLRS